MGREVSKGAAEEALLTVTLTLKRSGDYAIRLDPAPDLASTLILETLALGLLARALHSPIFKDGPVAPPKAP